MLSEFKKDFFLVRILLILLIIAVGSYVFGMFWQSVGIFSDILVILICAWLLSFILEPVVDYLTQVFHLPKIWATIITYLLLTGLFMTIIFLFIPTLTQQLQGLTKVIPTLLKDYPQFSNRFGETIASSLNSSIILIPSVANFLFSLIIVLILSFYFNIDREEINKEIFSLTPKNWHEKIQFFQKVIHNIFASFLRVQLIFGISSGIITWVILTLLQVPYTASTSFLSGIFAAIPLIGPLLALIPPVFVALTVDPITAVITFVILLAFQQVLFNVVGPRLFGKAFKLHPVIILLSFLIGIKIAGGIGAIFAIPVIGIAAVTIRQLSHYFFSSEKDLVEAALDFTKLK